MEYTNNVVFLVGKNRDDITAAVEGLDIFSKNWCMNCAKTIEKGDLVFNCDGCTFLAQNKEDCLIKLFANTHLHDFPMVNFGPMGDIK